MSSSWEWPGSRWWRVDLHTHSPASRDFMPVEERNAKDWQAWSAAAIAAGLDAVALTDHDTPEGIDGVRAAAAGRITLFPGVEINVGGIHLLVVFDPAQSRDGVVGVLSKLGIDSTMYGRDDASSSKSIVDAIAIATEAGGVVLAAHVNAPKGIITTLQGRERIKALEHAGTLGAEVSPLPSNGDAKSGWLDPRSLPVQSWLDGSNAAVGRILPQLHCSDAHTSDDLGRRFTWVKMTRRDIEGLRLALLDGADSLQPATRESPTDPNSHASCVIESIKIGEAKYMGRSAPLTVKLNPWMNAIIGGRGTGKSTLIDFCRAAFRREGELPSTGETSLRAAFDSRMRVPSKRGEEGLLTEKTLVEVTYRKDGERFVIAWDPDGRAAPISRIKGDDLLAEEGDIRERFPVRIYSQKQLFELAKQPNALLDVIDDADAVRGAELKRARDEFEKRYLALCAEARSLRAHVAELPNRRAALDDVEHKVNILQRGGHAQALGKYRLRRQQNDTWTSIRESLDHGLRAAAEAAAALVVADLDAPPEGGRDAAFAALQSAHAQTRVIVEGLRRGLAESIETARRDLAAIDAGAALTTWREIVAATDEQYESVSAELAKAGIANPDEYRDLLQLAATLGQEIQILVARQGTAAAREAEAVRAVEQYRAQRDELSRRREQFARDASSELIRVDVRASADTKGFSAFLRDTLGIDRFDKDYEALVAQANLSGGAWAYEKLDDMVRKLRALVTEPGQSWAGSDRRFETALRKLPPERIDRLALYTPEDEVEVKFRDATGSASPWQALAQGSPGQQTAALLAFVLGYGTEPILLDQPEDDLDNKLIYDLVVQRLRRSKRTRQIIVVTHSSNIVVHGDAELVLSLEARKGETSISCSGGLQEQKVRTEICSVMEGGSRAFETRYRRITQAKAPGHG